MGNTTQDHVNAQIFYIKHRFKKRGHVKTQDELIDIMLRRKAAELESSRIQTRAIEDEIKYLEHLKTIIQIESG